MENQLAFYFDSSACSGCKACQVACKDKHDLPADVKWRRVYEVAGGDWVPKGASWVSEVFAYNLSIACNHCEEPICMNSCPNLAISKDENGIVLIDPKRCMGCHYCEWTCPYGALQFNRETGVMTKCTFCIDYLKEGKPPACVSACPMRVLEFGILEELEEKHGNKGEIYPLPLKSYTKPAIVIRPHPVSKPSGYRNAHIVNKEEV